MNLLPDQKKQHKVCPLRMIMRMLCYMSFILILVGHADGITYIDSRGDGRHLISNSKDQSIKLWDIRVFSDEDAVVNSVKAAKTQSWDYRWHQVPSNRKSLLFRFLRLI